jgi:MFS transporter, DHA1 family, tetracycline resistance protein
LFSDKRIIALACTLLGGLGQGVVSPKLPELLHNGTYLALQSGVSATLMYFGIYISTFRFGKMADRGHVHRVLTGGLCGYCLALLLMGFAPNNACFFAARFIEGLSLSAVFVAADFLLGRLSASQERGEWLSYYGVALSIGLLLGPALALLIPHVATVLIRPEAASRPWVPMVFVSFIALLLSLNTAKIRVTTIMAESATPLRPLPRSPLLVGSAYGFMEAALVAVLPILAVLEFHVKPEYCLIAAIVSAALFSVFWGKAADRFGARKIVSFLLLILVLGNVLLLLLRYSASGAVLAYSSCILYGALAGGLYPTGFAWLLESVNEAEYGHASGGFARAYCLGSLLGPVVVGFAVSSVQSAGMFAPLGLLGLFVLLALKAD